MGIIYVLVENYPSDKNKYAMAYVHPRVKGYINAGFSVRVISFSCKENYQYDGIEVYSAKCGLESLKVTRDNILISHAPNIKHHLVFIAKAWRYDIQKLLLFFHGHEVLKTTKYYPKPYKFNKRAKCQYRLQNIYDLIKLPVMKYSLKYLLKRKKCELIFVSSWMLNATNVSLSMNLKIGSHIHIISNSLNPYIKEAGYQLQNKKADFVTIRPLDQSKYAVDIVMRFALKHPSWTFHIYGKGEYFNYNEKPDNVRLINDYIVPQEMPFILNSYKCALMPTRLDAQGVMMCEMASYGIPTIVSDIEVCHEMLDTYDNVLFLNNDHFDCTIEQIPQSLSAPNNKFSIENTIDKEISLLKSIV